MSLSNGSDKVTYKYSEKLVMSSEDGRTLGTFERTFTGYYFTPYMMATYSVEDLGAVMKKLRELNEGRLNANKV